MPSIFKMERTKTSDNFVATLPSLTSARNKTQLMKAMSAKKNKRWFTKVAGSFKSLDVYGERIEFTYKGQKTYQTVLGAFFSILYRVLVICFLCYELLILFTRAHTLTSTYKEIVNFDTFGEYFPIEEGFDIGFSISG